MLHMTRVVISGTTRGLGLKLVKSHLERELAGDRRGAFMLADRSSQ